MTHMPWMQQQYEDPTTSGSVSPSAFTSSPSSAPSEVASTMDGNLGIYAPQPEHAQSFQTWDDAMQQVSAAGMDHMSPMHNDMGLGLQPMEYHVDMQAGMSMQDYGLEASNTYGDASQCAMEVQDFNFQGDYSYAIDAQQF